MSFDDDTTGADCDGIDFKWMQEDSDSYAEEEENDRDGGALPKIHGKEKSWRAHLRRIILRNPTTRINISIVYITAKVIMCALYVVRVCLDDPQQYACHGVPCNTTSKTEGGENGFTSTDINWHVLLWVRRPLWLWAIQVFLAAVTLLKTCIIVGVTVKGNLFMLFSSRIFLLEMVCSLPFVFSVLWPPLLENIFIPHFLNCWLALIFLKRLLNDFHLAKQRFQTMSVTLSQQSWFLIATLCCLIFTTICGIQHIQRGSYERQLNMFESVYFVIVTLSTVGYGDISPDIWLGQLFMCIMICVAFSFIPRQLEEIGSTWSQRKKMGGDYSKRASNRGKHVVVIGAEFTIESVMSFLSEFFEHPKLEHYTVIMMSSEELDDNMQFILKDPKWANRVLYIRGSALKDIDLKRCRINEAEACFFLINKNCGDVEKADQHTVLRSWAVKDFAPNCSQYIQLYKASNKIHVKFAEHVISEDEFKFALLANNCLYPGLSTLVTLILHTSRGQEGSWAPEAWQQVYGRHSGNEIYHIQLGRSIFFREYEGKKFTYASVDAHNKYGVNLIAVFDSTAGEAKLQLNPGPDYTMKASDYCFYMSLSREENMKISPSDLDEGNSTSDTRNKNIGEPLLGIESSRMLEKPIGLGQANGSSPRAVESFDRVHAATVPVKVVQHMIHLGKESMTIGPPPSTLNLGTRRTLCHLHKEPRHLCCLEWGKPCEHCSYKLASDHRWDHQLVILSVKQCCPGLYNFIIPLRSNYLSLLSLSPIILMFEERPTRFFLETIAHFPLVFWMQGALTSLDDLLVAGVNKAIHLVISHIQADPGGEENLNDAETIVAVQKISRLFPHVNIITEVNEASNMRFMQFKAKDTYMSQIRKLEKRLKEQALSHLPYMFRLPFAAGKVFSSHMLDRLLYQTFVKGYLISFVRLLLGIDAEKNSGHLSSVRVRRATLSQFPSYGDLYQGLCSTTGEIPIAIYRTEKQNFPTSPIEMGEELTENNNTTTTKAHSKHSKLFHFHEHSKKNLRSSRTSVGAVFSEKEKHSVQHLEEMVQARMESLGLANKSEPYTIKKPPKTLSYVIVNPAANRKLKSGDIVYVIQPSSMQAVPNKLNRSSRTMSKAFRSRHISINTSSINRAAGDSSGSPGSPVVPLEYPLISTHAPPPSRYSLKPTDVLVEVKTNSDKNILKEEDEFEPMEMRPRCRSDSHADRKCGGFVPKQNGQESQM
ncbi:potassium channel subfamily T member 2-like isoform X3 [Biomphalaria glabrata]|uniref:Potassium channel subfamily T member 2-like isoform X3 n=1 Tax=Biomphalaria glabrata TaxID=6526 RepID=A0A9W2ZBN7_BIOGL|nr:potassium channel subfamily T member 2-like isoform X3 [Biomphalaria glabrata]